MILIIDNYDSFTYNLAQYVGEQGEEVHMVRNDELNVNEIPRLQPDGIILSPGPGRPEDAGITPDLIRQYSGRYPIFGVCLGHQCIGTVFGAAVRPASRLIHGKTSKIYHDRRKLFRTLPSPFKATRYHSLSLDPFEFPETLEITAHSEKGEIMGIRHRSKPVIGVQFHPESILTDHGKQLIQQVCSWFHRFKENPTFRTSVRAKTT